MSIHRPAIAVATVLLVVAAGCTRPGSDADSDDTIAPAGSPPSSSAAPSSTGAETTAPSTSTATTEPTDSTVETTAPATTSPDSTVPATTAGSTTPTTTEAPPDPDDLTLTFDSVGPHKFGDRDVDVIPALAALLGSPTRDDAAEYPVADEGRFLDEFEEESFIAPFGRTVCFVDALCVQFGAGAPETLIMSGWRLSATSEFDLATADGIAIESTWADHLDAIAVEPLNSCFQIAYADSGGVDVSLQSAGEPFAAPNDDGEFVAGDPDPADVTVIEMSAGELPFFVFADC